eukprot:SAG31_NODE_2421_length_5725_cov_14.985605_3_plen_261_part_00
MLPTTQFEDCRRIASGHAGSTTASGNWERGDVHTVQSAVASIVPVIVARPFRDAYALGDPAIGALTHQQRRATCLNSTCRSTLIQTRQGALTSPSSLCFLFLPSAIPMLWPRPRHRCINASAAPCNPSEGYVPFGVDPLITVRLPLHPPFVSCFSGTVVCSPGCPFVDLLSCTQPKRTGSSAVRPVVMPIAKKQRYGRGRKKNASRLPPEYARRPGLRCRVRQDGSRTLSFAFTPAGCRVRSRALSTTVVRPTAAHVQPR